MSEQALDHILEERKRQREVENFDDLRDDKYINGELAQAGNCYRIRAELSEAEQPLPSVPYAWPGTWDSSWWKPTTRLRNLEKAGALYQAEIERLLRLRGKVEEAIDKELQG